MAKLTDENRPGLADSALFEALICLVFVQLSSAEKSGYQCVNLLNMRWPTLYKAATNTRPERNQTAESADLFTIGSYKGFFSQ